ncbi:MAG: PilZ domain-containing protein [Proteobacteria bacterium]|nr:PilZ domain-containing protein [Pseudomonadota bacterium]
MSQNNDMRQFKRVKENINVKLDVLKTETFSNKFEIGKTENISASGVLIRYDKPIDIGQNINVSFLSPNSFEIFSLNALVVRVEITLDNQYDIGVSFFNMTEDDKKRLNYYLTYH